MENATPFYTAAREVSALIVNHFLYHMEIARQRGTVEVALPPDVRTVENMIDVAFWTSLRKEEGRSPRISLVYLSPEQARKTLVLTKPLLFTPENLTKLAPGLERSGIHLGIWRMEEELYIWGSTLSVPDLSFVLDVSEPALLVIKHRSLSGYGKFTNVAVLQGDKVKVVDETKGISEDAPAILQWLMGAELPLARNESVNILIQLALSMRSHGRGGILLVVPGDSDAWMDSIIQPMSYAITPRVQSLAELVRSNGSEISPNMWQTALRREIDHLAGLTAIDGATVITENHQLLAFGAKIGMKEGGSRVKRISVIEPIAGSEARVIHPAQGGGTRHLSAAQFVHDQRNATALVASQDGQFTIIHWSEARKSLLAHRIESLLL